MSRKSFRRGVLLSWAFASATQALNLDTFGGQAEAKQLTENIVGKSLEEQRELLTQANVDEEEAYTCSESKSCKSGCCGPLDDEGNGICGMGPEFCGKECTSGCEWKSECDPGWGSEWSNTTTCPLNVCCSDHGFCGTSEGYCGDSTLVKPECDASDRSASQKIIGYYQGWNYEQECGTMDPEDIPLGYYTHIFFSFAYIDPENFRIDEMDEETARRYGRVTALKEYDPELEVWISIGGWAMNNEGRWRNAFSDMAKSEENQDEFFDSLVSLLKQYGFDGVDLDWEYPGAPDRGGVEEDYKSYVNLLKRLRARLNMEGRKYGLTTTLPASYWYLRGFDIVNMEPYLDWFNVMTYDIHDDARIDSLGPYASAHSNLTEIEAGLDLLWRNNINPERVVMGLGFYGRSVVVKSSDCLDAGCEFKEEGEPGRCTNVEGVLSAMEIGEIIKDGGEVTLDEKAAVNIVTWDTDKWASVDDEKTLKMKMDYAHSHCLGGTMVWAIDLDDGKLIDALGKVSGLEKRGTILRNPYIQCFQGDWEEEL